MHLNLLPSQHATAPKPAAAAALPQKLSSLSAVAQTDNQLDKCPIVETINVLQKGIHLQLPAIEDQALLLCWNVL